MELSINQLHLQFFGHYACLHDISLRLSEGVHVLYGEQGAGKTALLKCLVGLNHYEGDILLDGQPPTYGPQGDIGMVFDDLAMLERRSLWYNLTYPLRVRRVDKAQWSARLQPVLQQWGLQKVLLDNAAFRYDASIRVRAALARSQLYARRVWLLDNPLRSLRPNERREVFAQLAAAMHRHEGIVVYATDDADEVRAEGDSVIMLSGGYLVAQGNVMSLCHNPPCVYAAQTLIPQYCLLQATAQNGVVCTPFGDVAQPYPETYEGKSLTVGVSPQCWQATPDPTADGEVCAHVVAGGQPHSLVVHPTGVVGIVGRYALGERLHLRLCPPVHLYDSTTELRLVAATEGEPHENNA